LKKIKTEMGEEDANKFKEVENYLKKGKIVKAEKIMR
jgi:hypothetical protein